MPLFKGTHEWEGRTGSLSCGRHMNIRSAYSRSEGTAQTRGRGTTSTVTLALRSCAMMRYVLRGPFTARRETTRAG
jgi:hypothetical protein